jgi:hypothetical protein
MAQEPIIVSNRAKPKEDMGVLRAFSRTFSGVLVLNSRHVA